MLLCGSTTDAVCTFGSHSKVRTRPIVFMHPTNVSSRGFAPCIEPLQPLYVNTNSPRSFWSTAAVYARVRHRVQVSVLRNVYFSPI